MPQIRTIQPRRPKIASRPAHHAGEVRVGESVEGAHGEAERALVGGEGERARDRQGGADEPRPGGGGAVQELHEVQRGDHQQRRVERDQGVRELEQAGAAGPEDELRRAQEARMEQARMDREGEDEDDREDDEGEPGPDPPARSQQPLLAHPLLLASPARISRDRRRGGRVCCAR
jgi:hypothetical protein